LYKDDTPGEEESMFSPISDNKIKNMEEHLDEGEDVTTFNKKRKKKKKKKKKEPKEKESTVPRKYEQSIEGKQEKDNPILAAEDVVEKEAAQDAPGQNAPFLSSLTAYDHLVSSYPYPSSEFPPDNPDSTQKKNHDHYQHYHAHGYKTDTATKIANDASSFYDRLHVGYNEGHHQMHPYLHQNPNVSTQVRESSQVLEEATTTVVTSNLLHNNDHNNSMDSHATTTIGSDSGDDVTGDVEVDAGMLQTKRSLNSIAEDCTLCTSSTVIAESDDFRVKVSDCHNNNNCPGSIPIGCWNTSKVTDMANAFDGLSSFNDSINCWNVSSVNDMKYMFQDATNIL
jgi:hypothetical protein